MKLFAISDIHVRHSENLAYLDQIEARPNDWLIVAGDVGEDLSDLALAFDRLVPRFAKVIWVPGNHELWTMPQADRNGGERGEAKYRLLVEACRARGVLTPEDPYPLWPGDGPPTVIVPMFLLYDYSFRPPDVSRAGALPWALEADTMCVDEELLHSDPYPTREDWCAARVAETERRLAAIPPDVGTVLVNHFPLRYAHAWLPLIPRFSLWCGTNKTDDWHIRFRARAVVYGHLHIPRTHVDGGVPFEEVSLGYPRQRRGRPHRLRQIWPRLA